MQCASFDHYLQNVMMDGAKEDPVKLHYNNEKALSKKKWEKNWVFVCELHEGKTHFCLVTVECPAQGLAPDISRLTHITGQMITSQDGWEDQVNNGYRNVCE